MVPSTVAILASSYSAGIFEEFLIRGELGMLAPVFIFHLMSAAIAQLSYYPYPTLRLRASAELDTMNQCLAEMTKRYPTALGAQRVVQRLTQTSRSNPQANGGYELKVSHDDMELFKYLDPCLCGMLQEVTTLIPNVGLPAVSQKRLNDSLHRLRGRMDHLESFVTSNSLVESTAMVDTSASSNRQDYTRRSILHGTDTTTEALSPDEGPIPEQQEFIGLDQYQFDLSQDVGNWMFSNWMTDRQ